MATTEVSRIPASKSSDVPRLHCAVARNDTSRDAWKCSPLSAFASAAVVFVAMVILGSVYLGTWRPRRGEAIDEHEQPFCCPKEAQQTLRYVNNSVDPCYDFFAYVCSNVMKFRTWQDTSTQSELDRIVFTGAMPPGVERSPAGDFLIAYFRSCVKEMASTDYFASDIADSLVRKERRLLNGMDRKKAFVYATTVTSKYQIATAIYILYDTFSGGIFIRYKAICSDKQDVRHVIATSVVALNVGLNVSMTIKNALEFKATICIQIYSTKIQVTSYTAANRSIFYDEVWSIEDLESGLDSIGSSLSKAQFISAYSADRLGRMHHILSTLENSAIEEGVIAAYFLWHSVMSINDEFYASDDSTPQSGLKACNRSLEKVWHLSYSFKVDMLKSPQKDAHARAIFADVRDAVRAECMGSGLIQEDYDIKLLENFFQDLTLHTPVEVRPSKMVVSRPSPDFFDNLLRGHEYNFQAEKEYFKFIGKENVRYYVDIPFIGRSRVYLPLEIYGSIRAGTENVHLVNMAALGRTLAEALWFIVFYGIPWTSGTMTNFFRRKCYDTFYGTNAEDNSRQGPIFITALGLSSVLKAFKRPAWYSVKPAWSLLRLSHGQLFYILATYARCPKRPSFEDVYYINTPLIYVKDFAEAFFLPIWCADGKASSVYSCHTS